jgi:hypothetical protein
MRMCRIVICDLSVSTTFFPHYLIKGTIFEKKVLLKTKCQVWLSLQLLSETFLILRRNERDMIINVYWSSCKVPVIPKCEVWLSLQLLSETLLILRRSERDMIIDVCWSSCKVPVITVRSKQNLNFLNTFSKNTQISNFINIRPVGAELFHADRRTDRHDEANSRFSQFCERA